LVIIWFVRCVHCMPTTRFPILISTMRYSSWILQPYQWVSIYLPGQKGSIPEAR